MRKLSSKVHVHLHVKGMPGVEDIYGLGGLAIMCRAGQAWLVLGVLGLD